MHICKSIKYYKTLNQYVIKLPSLVEYGSKLMYNVKIKLDDELTNYTLKKLSPIFDKHNMVTRGGMSLFFHSMRNNNIILI